MAPLYQMNSIPNWQIREVQRESRQISVFPSGMISINETDNNFHTLGKIGNKYVFITPPPVVKLCTTSDTKYTFPVGQGPGDLTELSPFRSKSTWLTDPQQIYIFTEVIPLLAGILVFMFFLMVALVLIYGLIRHFYLDHVLPTIFFTLKPLRKDKLKVIYLKFPDDVAYKNLAFYKWNPIRKCYRRHSVCQLHHNHRNHRKLSDHEKPNDKLAMAKLIKAESESRSLSNLNSSIKAKPTVAVAKFMTKRKRKVVPLQLDEEENESIKLPSKEISQTAKSKKSIIEEAMKKATSFRYQQQQQQFPTAEVMMSLNDINIPAFKSTRKVRRKTIKRTSIAPKLTVPKKVLGKSPTVRLPSDAAKEDPSQPPPVSHTNKKRKSSTIDPNLEKNTTQSLPQHDVPNEGAVVKKLIRRKKTIAPDTTTINQGKKSMKTLRRHTLANANMENNQNDPKNDTDNVDNSKTS